MAYNPNFRGKIANAPSRSFSTGYVNGTLSGMLIGKPVSTNTVGQIVLTNVSDEDSVNKFVGITSEAIPSAATGKVYSGGRAEALAAGLMAFAIGDPVYLGKSSTLTNSKPDIGVAGFLSGDWVVFLGVVIKNEFNPSEKDIQLMIQVIGQL